MSIRKKVFLPNTALPASDVNDLSNNGTVEIYSTTDLSDADLDLTNAVYIVSDRTLRLRTSAGTGASHWSAPVWTGDPLPSQTGANGKFLKTNGTTASWETVPTGDSLPSQSGNDGKFLTTNGSAPSWASVPSGIPAGGTEGQVLIKLSNDDYDVGWSDQGYIPGAGGPENWVVTDGTITGGTSTGTYVDGAYIFRYHVFSTVDTTMSLTVTQPVIGQLLIVGGGGAGGYRQSTNCGGGGGAGALYYGDYAFGLGIHNCRVGAGGLAVTGFGNNGEESWFDDIHCHGGGGGAYATAAGRDGGSGGGGYPVGQATFGSGANIDLFRATNGFTYPTNLSGNGGGASMTSRTGYPCAITGTTVTYANGGYQGYNAGTQQTEYGSGGNGCTYPNSNMQNGVQGVVIVRYRIA